MRLFYMVLMVGLLVAGCSTRKSTAPAKSPVAVSQPKIAKAKPAPAKPPGPSMSVTNGANVITLANTVSGKVARVNTAARFVVLDYSLSRLPAVGDRLIVYRQGTMVGELKVSGPELNSNTVADMIKGDVQVGDEARKE